MMQRDKITIEIDCSSGVVSASSENYEVYSLAGAHQFSSNRSTLISYCLAPEIRKLMAMPAKELQERSLVAMGIVK